MKWICLLLLFPAANKINAQDAKKFDYLSVQIVSEWDMVGKRDFYQIVTGPDLFTAPINTLQIYHPNKTNDSSIAYYHMRPQNNRGLYNYFLSETEALRFLGAWGWELIGVDREMKSSADRERVWGDWQVYTKIVSGPVKFYFKKPID